MPIKHLKFKRHRCFSESWAGFDRIAGINVIIGRNNTGKSQLLDLLQSACAGNERKADWEILVRLQLEEPLLKRHFDVGTSGGGLYGDHWHNHGRYFLGKTVEASFSARGGPIMGLRFLEDENDIMLGLQTHDTQSRDVRTEKLAEVVRRAETVLLGKQFRRILADRDIRVETSNSEMSLGPDGGGATNIVRRFLQTSNTLRYPRKIILTELLTALNEIFGDDGHFTLIEASQHDEPNAANHMAWEIYLSEEHKGAIALSQSGSGLKTVILVLLNLIVLPVVLSKGPNEFVYAFEELENNLHPALQRRLLTYISTHVKKSGCTVFLTTHSSVALDLFMDDKDAQIVGVTHDKKSASTRVIDAPHSRYGIVSELGAKPSDLLQANGVIWVEGPSDRIYLNRWIELESGGRFREGRDYLCAFYGGALLNRVEFKQANESEETEMVNLVKLNSNVAVVCDSDRLVAGDDKLKSWVVRVKKEVEAISGGYCWITSGKEIENYLTAGTLRQLFERERLPAPGQFEAFFPNAKEGESYFEKYLRKRSFDKVQIATNAAQFTTLEDMRASLDWSEKIGGLVSTIARWNR